MPKYSGLPATIVMTPGRRVSTGKCTLNHTFFLSTRLFVSMLIQCLAT